MKTRIHKSYGRVIGAMRPVVQLLTCICTHSHIHTHTFITVNAFRTWVALRHNNIYLCAYVRNIIVYRR